MKTDVTVFLGDLNAGTYEEKIASTLSQVAAAVIDHGREGSITLKFKIKQIGQSQQVTIDHSLAYSRPTARGKMAEEESTRTPMHVNDGGEMTLFPKNQHQLFSKTGEIPGDPES